MTETDDLIAVHKPASIPVHVSGQYRKNTVMALLQVQRPDLGRLFPVHRLDKPVSGLLLIAKTAAAANDVRTQMMVRSSSLSCQHKHISYHNKQDVPPAVLMQLDGNMLQVLNALQHKARGCTVLLTHSALTPVACRPTIGFVPAGARQCAESIHCSSLGMLPC